MGTHRRGRGGLDGYGDLIVRTRAVHEDMDSRAEWYVHGMCIGGTTMRDLWLTPV